MKTVTPRRNFRAPQHVRSYFSIHTLAIEGKALSSSPSRYTTIRISNLWPTCSGIEAGGQGMIGEGEVRIGRAR